MLLVDFGANSSAPFTPANHAVIGKSIVGSESLADVRVAAESSSDTSEITAYQAFGSPIPGVTVTVFNAPTGPDAHHPHLELSVTPYSAIPAALGLAWDRSSAYINLEVLLGSSVDGPIGAKTAAQNDSPTTPSPSPSRNSTASRTAAVAAHYTAPGPLSTGGIVGVCVGSVALLFLFLFILWRCNREDDPVHPVELHDLSDMRGKGEWEGDGAEQEKEKERVPVKGQDDPEEKKEEGEKVIVTPTGITGLSIPSRARVTVLIPLPPDVQEEQVVTYHL